MHYLPTYYFKINKDNVVRVRENISITTNKRIQDKTKWMPPVKHRETSME